VNLNILPLATVDRATSRRAVVSYRSLQMIAAVVDVCVLVLASVLGFAIYQYSLTRELSFLDDSLGVGVAAGVLFVALSRAQGLYQLQALLAPSRNLGYLLLVVTITFLALINFMFLLKVDAEHLRGSVIVFGALAFAPIAFGRVALGRLSAFCIQRGTIAGRRAVTIGEASELERLAASDLRLFGVEEMARVAVERSDGGPGLNERARSQIAGAIALARKLRAAEFVLILPWDQERLLDEVGSLLRPSPLPVTLLPDFATRNIVGRRGKGAPELSLAIETQREPLSRWDRACKRTLDLGLSVIALTLLAPFLSLIALAIKLDSKGPALFRQRRCGFDNREFVIFKFRTMTALDDGAMVEQAHVRDVRVTRVGRLLRRSSLDELPQLLNVIRGHMSLVGPRPHAMAHHDQYGALIASYSLRHHVKPGLTGMAQMRGLRGETLHLAQMERRVEQDLWYINHWSLALDIMIMARTCFVLLHQDVH
jgi:putative colanic acid biosynthesis UDP-glucose lipid carrier transferase